MKRAMIAVLLLITLGSSAQKINSQPSAKEKLNELYCTGMFKTSEGDIIDVADQPGVTGYRNILDWLAGRVAGLQVVTSRTGIAIPLLRGQVPGIYIDENFVPVATLQSLNTSDVAMIKVIKGPFYGGWNNSAGAIAVYTYGSEGDDEE
jgi:hypothetical protein